MSTESDILDELKKEKVTRKDIIPLYASCIYWRDFVNIKKVNKAIINKWSISGLIYIKKGAWEELKVHSSHKGGRK